MAFELLVCFCNGKVFDSKANTKMRNALAKVLGESMPLEQHFRDNCHDNPFLSSGPKPRPCAWPVLRSIRKVSLSFNNNTTLARPTKEDDALIMPFLRKLEESNRELQNAQHRGSSRAVMKQILNKVTQERLEVLKIARAQLSQLRFKRLKRLLLPLAKDVEKVGAQSKVNH